MDEVYLPAIRQVCAADTVDIARKLLSIWSKWSTRCFRSSGTPWMHQRKTPVLFVGKFKSGTNEDPAVCSHFQPEGPCREGGRAEMLRRIFEESAISVTAW